MRCKKNQNYFLGYEENTLSRSLKGKLQEHLHLCPSCREEFSTFSKTKELLLSVIENETVPPCPDIPVWRMKREETSHPFFYPAFALAAVLILFFSAYLFFNSPSEQPGTTAYSAIAMTHSLTLPQKKPLPAGENMMVAHATRKHSIRKHNRKHRYTKKQLKSNLVIAKAPEEPASDNAGIENIQNLIARFKEEEQKRIKEWYEAKAYQETLARQQQADFLERKMQEDFKRFAQLQNQLRQLHDHEEKEDPNELL